ncbi:hypothetical protein AZ22_3648 [Bordetella bronchiseptica 980-2]|uniref:Phage tail protein n=1 Tax=Bordetella bronchiseptica (strain ATCC BAA-588 / NCTC 13252 / RB50) TaxID=257310 RepID=A0A0H3M0X1_BORBR|nr:hypothetical protein [Bordetella bronchiseptica]KAK64297.1 hypothetical protein AZ22_3648 [Bordetella bronchiseptica 980-2]KDB88472.1 hypothetical protein AZ17_3765 [Bordetella bronchiseptica D989]KDD64547.1 hypothetical protein L533_3822 [Bordetella bronchiseptica OSU553]CAE35583.1 phage-related hypothetical protein [Bordetella bronchiseptica RB50]
MRRIDTVDGLFEAGDPTIRKPGSRLPAWYMNLLQEELCSVVEGSGLVLDPEDPTQLYQAIQRLVAEGQSGFVVRRASIPTEKIADEVYVAGWGEMVWVETTYFTGYRSPLCGRPVDGHTQVPLVREVDAVGGLLSKVAYAGLWGYAREENLVVSQAAWTASIGAHHFVDVSETQFRVPDLRNMFRRYTGTDADTANARVLGGRQADQVKSHRHALNGYLMAPTASGGGLFGPNTGSSSGQAANYIEFSGGAESRPINTAYHPRLHA